MTETHVATDPIQLLIDDHATVLHLISQYEELSSSSAFDSKSQQLELMKTLVKNLSVHEELEEQIFYPFFKQQSEELKDKEIVDQSLLEHHKVDILVKDLLLINDPNLEEFQSQMKLMIENLKSHIEKEEKEVFPKARDIMGDRSLGLLDSMLKLRSKLESEMMQASDATLQEKGEEKASIEKSIPDLPGAPTEIHQATEVTEAEGMKDTAATGGEPVIAGDDSAAASAPAPPSNDSVDIEDGTASITGKKHPAAGSAKKGTVSKKAKQR